MSASTVPAAPPRAWNRTFYNRSKAQPASAPELLRSGAAEESKNG